VPSRPERFAAPVEDTCQRIGDRMVVSRRDRDGKGMTDFTQYHLWRNAIWLVAKDFPLGAMLRHAPRLLYVQAAQVVVATRAGRLALWARAIGAGSSARDARPSARAGRAAGGTGRTRGGGGSWSAAAPVQCQTAAE